MNRSWAALAVVVLSGCSQFDRPTYREPDPDPLERPKPLPERIVRKAPDFRLKDPESGKTYFYRGLAETRPDGTEFQHEVDSVLDPKGDFERDATDEERAYALDVLEKDWRNKGLEEQIKYHQEMARIGRERRNSLIDVKIAFAEQAVKH